MWKLDSDKYGVLKGGADGAAESQTVWKLDSEALTIAYDRAANAAESQTVWKLDSAGKPFDKLPSQGPDCREPDSVEA